MDEWINIKDSLPEFYIDVLVWVRSNKTQSYEDGEMYAAIDRIFECNNTGIKSFRTDYFGYGLVTHWTHLPKSPRE